MVVCKNKDCNNTFESVKRGGYYKVFCCTKCRKRYHSYTSPYDANKTTTNERPNMNITNTNNKSFHNRIATAAINSGAAPLIGKALGGQNSVIKGIASAVIGNAVIPQINKLINEGYIKPIPTAIGVGAGYFVSRKKSPLIQLAFMAGFGFIGHRISNLNFKFDFNSNHKKPILNNQIQSNAITNNLTVNKVTKEVLKNNIIDNKNNFIKSEEILKNSYQSYDMTGSFWSYLWGSMTSKPFHVISYGLPGSGKTTLSMKFAKYFSDNFGKTVLLSSEMKNGKGLQDLIKRTNAKSILIDIDPKKKTVKEHIEVLKLNKVKLLIIDSANHLEWSSLAIEEIKDAIPTLSVYTILQSVKDGDFRGDNTFAHNSDIVIQVDKGKAFVKKSRFGKYSLDGVDIF